MGSKYSWWGYAMNVVKDLQWYMEAEQMPTTECRERDALLKAIEKTKQLPQGTERLSIIGFVYWNGKKHTIKEAAEHVGILKTTAMEWHRDFVRLVGECLGFDTNKPSKQRGPGQKNRKILANEGPRGKPDKTGASRA